MRNIVWRLKLWYLKQLEKEARQMSRAHWNIAKNNIEDHIKGKYK